MNSVSFDPANPDQYYILVTDALIFHRTRWVYTGEEQDQRYAKIWEGVLIKIHQGKVNLI